ncbi:MAG: pilus assembly protein [Thiohalocapsa sp.]
MKQLNTHTLLIAGSIALLTTAATAAPRGGPGMGCDEPNAKIERMTDQLDLTEVQQEQISAIFDEQRRTQDAQRQQVREQIDAVLTDEQRAERDERMAERMNRRVERMAERLDLTEDQQAAVLESMTQRREDSSMTRDQVRERMAEVLTDEQQEQLAERRERRGHGGGKF